MNRVHWMEYCKWCERKHYVMIQKCPTCDVYVTPQPVSDKVAEECRADYSCDGCCAYREHHLQYSIQ